MLANSSNGVQSGRIEKEIHLPSAARMELVEFIADELPRWRDHPDRPNKQSETSLTEHLCDHLNSATFHSPEWNHVQFRAETGDETNAGRKIDLAPKPRGVAITIEGRRHSQFDALFPIECKRLPTPEEKDRDPREYVITQPGTTGGIQRFKFGHHGATHTFGAMIAYVQQGTCTEWLPRVNEWIQDLATAGENGWSVEDTVNSTGEEPSSRLLKLRSSHQRVAHLKPIEIRHIWIEV